MNRNDLNEVLRLHSLWRKNKEDGAKADLRGADLHEADLCGAVGNMREIISLLLETWPVTITEDMIQIGCIRHTYMEWISFSDNAISAMDKTALSFWGKWKDTILDIYRIKFIGDVNEPA